MIYKNVFFFILLTQSFFSIGQEIPLKISKQPNQTESWDFVCENYALTGKAAIQISKTEKGGTLDISIESTDPTYFIGGVVYLYLSDYTIIVCTDKGIRRNQNSTLLSQYNFTASEMAKLRKTNIASIRFNIRGSQKTFGSQTGNFTAINKKTYFSTTEIKVKTFDTASEINSLYQ